MEGSSGVRWSRLRRRLLPAEDLDLDETDVCEDPPPNLLLLEEREISEERRLEPEELAVESRPKIGMVKSYVLGTKISSVDPGLGNVYMKM